MVLISVDGVLVEQKCMDADLILCMAKIHFLAEINSIPCVLDTSIVDEPLSLALEQASAWVNAHALEISPHALGAAHRLMIQSPFACPVRGSRVLRYAPLWASMAELLVAHGYNYNATENFTEFHNRSRMLCPNCGALGGEPMVAEYLRRRLGSGFFNSLFYLPEFAPRLEPHDFMGDFLCREFTLRRETADLFMPGVNHHLDLTHMPEMGSSSMDAWICLHMLEHIPHDVSAMHELYRILKPGGSGLVLTPVSLTLEYTDEDPEVTEAERWRRYGQDDHVRLYAKNDLVQRLQSVEFIVLQLGMDWFGSACFTRLGVPETAVLYVVKKCGHKETQRDTRCELRQP